MKILIIGNGGREHALAWKVAQSKQVETVWVAPGNAGTEQEAHVKNVLIPVDDIEKILHFAKEHDIDLTIIGPEQPLALGIVDRFTQEGLRCFGPTQQAARLETSKSFCKAFLHQHHIPTADYATFTDKTQALAYLNQQTLPIVIKANGLAAGKGVVIAQSFSEAENAIIAMLEQNTFGNAGQRIVIEEYLIGQELSFITMVDGKRALPLASSQDYKRRDDGDHGPNTGGMGAYSPAPLLTPTLHKKIMTQIINPAIHALQQQNIPYIGFLYAGLMITSKGDPYVLEFNCRLGDPETQSILMRLQSDLVALCLSALEGKLDHTNVQWDPHPAVSVVMAAGGYPIRYQKGDVIEGLDTPIDTSCKIFHAGTIRQNHHIVTNGGRVLVVTALGEDFIDAHNKAYTLVKKIRWKNCYYRHDIGYHAMALQSEKQL